MRLYAEKRIQPCFLYAPYGACCRWMMLEAEILREGREKDMRREMTNAELTRKRWLIVLISGLMNLCAGSLYAWSVFSAPMAEYLSEVLGTSLTAGNLAIVFTVANSVGPITMISGGAINDKLGPKWVLFLGGILLGGGFLLCGFAVNVGMVIVGFGLGGGLAMGLIYGSLVSNAVKLFPDKRGMIGGVMTATYGLSSVLVPPIANSLITGIGVTGAFRVLGLAFLVIICAGSFLIVHCPDDFVPTGWTPPAGQAGAAHDENWMGMLHTPAFYLMLAILVCGAFSGLTLISQASNIAQEIVGMSARSAAMVVSVLALFNVAGRVISGWLSDRIGRVVTLQAGFVLAVAGLALLLNSEGRVLVFYGGISLLGICFGSLMGIYPGFTADRFGQTHNSVNYGIMFIGFALAGLFGPMSLNWMHQASGSYRPAFLSSMVLAVLGILLAQGYKMLAKRERKAGPRS